MVKIEIPDDAKELHWQYFKSLISEDETKLKKPDGMREDYWCEFNLFVKLLRRKGTFCRGLAVGNWKTLKRLHQHIVAHKKRVDRDEGQERIYNEAICNLLGYKKFSQTDIYKQLPSLIAGKKPSNIKKDRYVKFLSLLSDFDSSLMNKCCFRHNITKGLIKDILNKEMTGIHTMSRIVALAKAFEVWNPYVFTALLGVTVCPYCNRSYIYTINTSNGKTRPELDHFLPQALYPHFSMSLYNLVPSCHVCNSNLKRTKDFGFQGLHPYNESIGDIFTYRMQDLLSNNPDIMIETRVGEEEKQKKESLELYLNTFLIKETLVYQHHIAQEFLRKRYAYTDEAIQLLMRNIGSMYDSVDQMKAELIGYVPRQEDINKEIFGKLKRDLAIQMGFLESTDDSGNASMVFDRNESSFV